MLIYNKFIDAIANCYLATSLCNAIDTLGITPKYRKGLGRISLDTSTKIINTKFLRT